MKTKELANYCVCLHFKTVYSGKHTFQNGVMAKTATRKAGSAKTVRRRRCNTENGKRPKRTGRPS